MPAGNYFAEKLVISGNSFAEKLDIRLYGQTWNSHLETAGWSSTGPLAMLISYSAFVRTFRSLFYLHSVYRDMLVPSKPLHGLREQCLIANVPRILACSCTLPLKPSINWTAPPPFESTKRKKSKKEKAHGMRALPQPHLSRTGAPCKSTDQTIWAWELTNEWSITETEWNDQIGTLSESNSPPRSILNYEKTRHINKNKKHRKDGEGVGQKLFSKRYKRNSPQ